MRKSFALLLALFSILHSTFSQVTLYDGGGFSGKAIQIEEGSISRMRNTDFGDNKLASVKIPAGYKVTLYENDYFQGKSVTLTQSSSAVPSTLSNNVSSVVISRSSAATFRSGNNFGWSGSSVRFYTSCYYMGRAAEAREGSYPSLNASFNNQVSSLRIPAGYEVLLFTQPNFRGQMARLRSDEWCIPPNWNNQVSSVKIYRTSGSGNGFPDDWDPWNPYPGWDNDGSWGGGNWDNYEVKVYDYCNYSGTSARLSPGRYSYVPNGLNNRISSIRVPSGLTITIYSETNFRGGSYTLTSSTSCLPYDLNDRISSMIVTRNNSGGGNGGGNGGWGNYEVQLYDQCNFSGTNTSLSEGRYSYVPNGMSRRISSLRVPAGYKVIGYAETNFRGTSTSVTSSTSCLGSYWNNRIASLEIIRAGSGGSQPQPYNEVVLYEECNFTGRKTTLKEGSYSFVPDGLNNRISSAQIPRGFKMLIFTENNFQGNRYTIDNSSSCLPFHINNQISSFIITREGSGGDEGSGSGGTVNGTVTVYTSCNYSGNRFAMNAFAYPSMSPSVAGNISSMRISGRIRVRIYSGANFTGRSQVVTGNISCFSSEWNNRIGSMMLENY